MVYTYALLKVKLLSPIISLLSGARYVTRKGADQCSHRATTTTNIHSRGTFIIYFVLFQLVNKIRYTKNT